MGSSQAAVAAAPKAADEKDLQTRHDEAAIELGLIDEALGRAGIAQRDTHDGVELPLSTRVDIALAERAVRGDALVKLESVLVDNSLQVEGEQAAETVVKLIGAHKSLLNDLADAQAEAQRIEAERAKAAEALSKRPKAVKGEQPKRLRPCGPAVMAEIDTGQPVASLLAEIEASETVELAFSDGTHELDDVPPMIISGAAWSINADRLLLTGVDLPMYGSSRDGQPFTLVGYGLFLDGVLAAYAPRINGPLQVAPGTTHSLNDDVVFS